MSKIQMILIDQDTHNEGYLPKRVLLQIFRRFMLPIGDENKLEGDFLLNENDSSASGGTRKRAAVELQVAECHKRIWILSIRSGELLINRRFWRYLYAKVVVAGAAKAVDRTMVSTSSGHRMGSAECGLAMTRSAASYKHMPYMPERRR